MNRKEFITSMFGVIPIITSVYLLITINKESLTAIHISFLVGIPALFALLLVYVYITDNIKKKLKKLDHVSKSLDDLKREVDYTKKINKLENRMNIMELKQHRKKGAVDIVVVILLIAIIVILYFFLKYMNILP